MSKRYDGSQQALDLKGLRSDPGMADSCPAQRGGDRAGGSVRWGRFENGLVLTLTWESPLRLAFPSFLFPKDLVAQNIDVVLNRRSCMAATLRIIEENIPEVRPLSRFERGGGGVGWVGWGWEANASLNPLLAALPLNIPLPAAVVLELEQQQAVQAG